MRTGSGRESVKLRVAVVTTGFGVTRAVRSASGDAPPMAARDVAGGTGADAADFVTIVTASARNDSPAAAG